MNRKFGIELEFTKNTEFSDAELARQFQERGFNVHQKGYTHDTMDCWKIVTDGSIRGQFGGAELVSPPLEGEEGLAEVVRVVECLQSFPVSVNKTCGFHVHFDAADLGATAIKTILRRYEYFEVSIDSFMPLSRRGDQNEYCRSLQRLRNINNGSDYNDLMSSSTIAEMASAQSSRYYKVNLQSFLRHGTIEFRQHSGTVEAKKVVNWIRFLCAFVDRSKEVSNTFVIPTIEKRRTEDNKYRISAKCEKLLLKLFDCEGVTLEYAMEYCDWSLAALKSGLRTFAKLGYDVTYNPRTNIISYNRRVAAPIDDTVFSGQSDDLVNYFVTRAETLSADRVAA